MWWSLKADTEGWMLFDTSDGTTELQRIDEYALFETDEDALRHVLERAKAAPNGWHRSALKTWMATDPDTFLDHVLLEVTI